MVKVIFYSSKKLYDTSSFEGRAEADVIGYADEYVYHIVKNKTKEHLEKNPPKFVVERFLQRVERSEWKRERDVQSMLHRTTDG